MLLSMIRFIPSEVRGISSNLEKGTMIITLVGRKLKIKDTRIFIKSPKHHPATHSINKDIKAGLIEDVSNYFRNLTIQHDLSEMMNTLGEPPVMKFLKEIKVNGEE